jgi:hypothetical protein
MVKTAKHRASRNRGDPEKVSAMELQRFDHAVPSTFQRTSVDLLARAIAPDFLVIEPNVIAPQPECPLTVRVR